MTTFRVVRKSDLVEVYRYQENEPVEWIGMEFATHDHVAVADEALALVPPTLTIWTVIEFKRRMTSAERIAARNRTATDANVADFMDLLDSAQEVRSDDPDVAAGLGYLTYLGDLAPGRAQEILA